MLKENFNAFSPDRFRNWLKVKPLSTQRPEFLIQVAGPSSTRPAGVQPSTREALRAPVGTEKGPEKLVSNKICHSHLPLLCKTDLRPTRFRGLPKSGPFIHSLQFSLYRFRAPMSLTLALLPVVYPSTPPLAGDTSTPPREALRGSCAHRKPHPKKSLVC